MKKEGCVFRNPFLRILSTGYRDEDGSSNEANIFVLQALNGSGFQLVIQ